MSESKLLDMLHRYGFGVAVIAVSVATLIFVPFRSSLDFAHLAWFYLVVVCVVAWAAGTGPAVLTAGLSFLFGNFFLTAPYGTFRVADPRDLIQLFVFLAGAITVGLLTGRLRERQLEAERSEDEATDLARLAAEMAASSDVETVVNRALVSVTRLAGVTSAVLWLRGDNDQLRPFGPGAASVKHEDRDLAKHVLSEVKAVGLPDELHGDDRLGTGWPARDTEVRDQTRGMFLPLVSALDVEGVLQVLSGPSGIQPGEASIAVSISNLLAVFMSSRRISSLAAQVQAAEEAGRVRSAIISAVSHELKTPLASAMAAVTDLASEDMTRDESETQARLEGVADDLRRLEVAISDLLDLSRLQAEAWLPQPETYEVGEILADVSAGAEPAVRERLVFEVEEDPTPLVYADFAQLSRALSAILDNAVAYTPADSEILLGAALRDDRTWVWIQDNGPGVSDKEKHLVFERGYRGAAGRTVPSGTGLGLAIANDLVSANGGEIAIEDAVGGGARFVLRVPAEKPAPEGTA